MALEREVLGNGIGAAPAQDVYTSHIQEKLQIEQKVEALLQDKKPIEVAGEIMVAGGYCKSYVPSQTADSWDPKIYGDGKLFRQMVVFARQGGPRLGLETLRPFLKKTAQIPGSNSHGALTMAFLPYVRFNEVGEFDPEESYLYILTESQLADLQRMAGIEQQGQEIQ